MRINTIISNERNNKDHKGTNGIDEIQMLTKIILTTTTAETGQEKYIASYNNLIIDSGNIYVSSYNLCNPTYYPIYLFNLLQSF